MPPRPLFRQGLDLDVLPVIQGGMSEITVRELRNRGGDVLERVARGEALIVTRDGQPIAELRPLRRRPIPAAVLVNRWRALPAVDPARLRADIDEVGGHARRVTTR